MVEALVCTKDWIAPRKGLSKNVSSVVGDLEVLDAVSKNLNLEVKI